MIIVLAGICCYVAGVMKLYIGDDLAFGLVWIVLGNLHFFVRIAESKAEKRPEVLKDIEARLQVLERGSEEARYMTGTWLS